MEQATTETPQLLGYNEALAIFHDHGLADLDHCWLKNQADRGVIPSTVIAKKRRFLRGTIEEVIAGFAADAARLTKRNTQRKGSPKSRPGGPKWSFNKK